MTTPRAPRVGDVFGHYRLEHVIGVGGMGQVFGARDLTLDRPVALKVVLGQFAESDDFTRRFQREASVLARLDSPHVVSIFDHGEQDGTPYIVTQYAAGGDLGRLLRERGPMPPGLAARVCSQIADALAAAHGVGVVHRDVKPANVLLRDDRTDRLHVYLCDFGVALTEGSGLTTPGAVAGTWNYLAPERTTGDPGSPASDVYSVGCLLWELVTGSAPYAGSDVEVAMQHLSAPVPQLPGADATTARLNRVLGLTLAKLPEHRYATAAQLRDELRDLAQDLTGGGSTTSGVALTPLPARRRRGLLVGGVVVALLVAGGVTTAVLASGGDGTPEADPTVAPTTPAPTTPTTPTTAPTTETPEPPAPEPVLGDLDGNGYGDLVLEDFDRTYVASSTGSKLGRLEPTPAKDAKVVGDFDGDGATELLRVEGDPPTLALTPVIADAPRSTSSMRTPRVDYLSFYDIDYLAADVDGDGADDLVVATPDGTGVILTVALNRGDGTFARSTTWLTTRLRWERTDWAIADLDDDGRDDLVHVRPNEFSEDPGKATALRSTGRAFRGLGAPLEVPKQYGDTFFSLDEFAAADVDGDGAPELVGFSSYGFDAVIWRWNGREFRGATVWAEGDYGPDGGGLDGTLVDVNGDGRADVVTSDTDVIRVQLSTGTSFRYAPGYTMRTRLPSGSDIIDSTSLGIG